jgi:hypothetical protein
LRALSLSEKRSGMKSMGLWNTAGLWSMDLKTSCKQLSPEVQIDVPDVWHHNGSFGNMVSHICIIRSWHVGYAYLADKWML